MCDTALGTYDAEQTNRLISCFGVRCPVFGVALTEVCYSAYVKTSRLCDTASWAWVGERIMENGAGETAHFMCAVLYWGQYNTLEALVWHDYHMAEDVSGDPLIEKGS